MNTYFNPEVIAEALAAGQSQEDIAAAMSKALNDAVATRNAQLAKEKAEKEAKEKAATIKAAEDNLKVAMRDWLKVALPVEVMNTLDEGAWADLDEVMDYSLAEVKTAMQHAGTLISMLSQLDLPEEAVLETKTPLKVNSTPTRAKRVGSDPVSILNAFLEDNGL